MCYACVDGRGGGRARYRYVNQSNLDNKARSKPLPVRLIRARFEPGIWRRCSSGFVGIGSVGDGDFSDSDWAFSLRRLRVPIWCSVLYLVLVAGLFWGVFGVFGISTYWERRSMTVWICSSSVKRRISRSEASSS